LELDDLLLGDYLLLREKWRAPEQKQKKKTSNRMALKSSTQTATDRVRLQKNADNNITSMYVVQQDNNIN